MEISRNTLVLSATRMEILQTCLKKYYYNYVDKRKREKTVPVDLALGLYFHKIVELYWVKEAPGVLRPKYKSKEKFINASLGYYKRFIVSTDKIQGKKIEWRDENQKWILLNSVLPKVLSDYHDLTQTEAPPLGVEVQFKISLDDTLLVGRIDELRKSPNGLTIRDHKFYRYKIPKDMEKDFNLQFTIYALTLTLDLKNYGDMSKAIGLSREESLALSGNNLISKSIGLEYHLLNTNQIIPATREDMHFLDIKTTIEGLKEKLRSGQESGNYYHERGSHCDFCLNKKICRQDTLENRIDDGQTKLELFPIDSQFIKKPRKNKSQIRIKFPKDKKE